MKSMKNLILVGLFGLLGLAWACVGYSDEPPFKEGVDYQRLPTPVPTSTGDRVEVVEVFWYGCPHCYHMEPTVAAWLQHKPANAEFVRVPAVFGPNWEPHARAFYAAEVLGVSDQIHTPLMDAIHKEHRSLNNEQQLADFFAEHGVNRDAFLQAYNSFEVETRLKRSQQLVQRYGITGVPAVVINGKYLTNGSMAGTYEKLFEIVDFLVAEESKTS